MKTAITNGTEIYEFVEEKLNIHPVGIMPVNSKEGYFLLMRRFCQCHPCI